MSSAVHVCVLSSTSSGNSTALWDDQGVLLLDAGLSRRAITRHLTGLGLAPERILGICITHSHWDHIRDSVAPLIHRHRIPIFTTASIWQAIRRRLPVFRGEVFQPLFRDISSTPAELAGFRIAAFPVPHDAPGGCVGYRVSHASGPVITASTDMGYVAESVAAHFIESSLIIIESNHDPDMLENSDRPRMLKKRITDIGHLSNQQCADFCLSVCAAGTRAPEAIILAHISQQCNTEALALETCRKALSDHGYGDVPVYLSHRSSPSEVVTLPAAGAPAVSGR